MVRIRIATALGLCLFAHSASAQDLKLPARIEGQSGAFLRIPAETRGKVVRWRVVDPGLSLFPMELLRDTRTAVAVAIRPGKFRLWAWTSIDDAPSDAAECLVIVGAGPGPEPPPDPPAPVDPFVHELRAALAKEPHDQPALVELAKVCLNTAAAARDPNNGDVKAVRDAFAGQVTSRVAPKLPHVRGVLVRRLDTKLPVTPVPLSDALRSQIANTFECLAASLERINQ